VAASEDGWLKIQYRDFYDIPRAFFVRASQGWLFFDCSFDDEADEYPAEYSVWFMGDRGPESFAGSWSHLSGEADREVGKVPVADVRFDGTRRRSVDPSVLVLLDL
jgi:hypothetical protein